MSESAPQLGDCVPADHVQFFVAWIRPAAGAQGTSYGELAALSLPNTTITSAAIVPAGPFSAVSAGDPYAGEATTRRADLLVQHHRAATPGILPRHGGIAEQGAAEPINSKSGCRSENWNGRLEAIGNHGFAGEIEYADMAPELNKGFAVAATDTGHAGSSAPPGCRTISRSSITAISASTR